ncbi:hypothetical protein LJC68_10345 [Bacteroidales bacterium OttesenSCG-928-B11]|nr:hypothetical protein [Bacteroidales bacterium OttesenSCG-928-C03]MDL2313261.1 hypothetical protein [Bacteroidales bacterium OttesenSCG-928-B11]
MKRIYISIFIFASCFSIKAQNQSNDTENYWNYHDLICKAEIAFYLNGNIDSCLYYYAQAFDGFSFNYVHDLVNAAQIAFYNQKDFKGYIYKGLEFGLKSSHLKQIRLFANSDIIQELENYEKTPEYLIIREKYLASVNLDYLNWIYDFGIEEQLEKGKVDYDAYSLNFINELKLKIKQFGFPSNRTIGINCSTIFAEAKRDELDLAKRVKSVPAVSYYKTDDQLLSNHFVMPPLHHRRCSYTELKEIMLEEIAKGNFHPREFGLLYDRQCECEITNYNPVFENCPNLIKENGVFRIGNVFLKEVIGKIECSDEQVNSLRRKYHIAPIEVDRAKERYERQYGFKLFWGFWDCL